MNYHISIGRVFGLSIFLVTLVAGILIYSRFTPDRVWLSSTSPNQKYTVELSGDKGRGGFISYAVVKYNVLIDKEIVTTDRLLHYGDAMDISFELAYPEHAWISEDTLRFWSNRHRREDKLDVLLVSNNTNKVIRFLRIKTWDLFFVFDVQPRSALKLLFTHRTEGKHLSVEGEFEDGSLIDYAVGFLSNNVDERLGYCMNIEDQAVTINSPQERAYDRQGNWDNLNINAAPQCEPYK
jgi:hypothetical protein